METCSVHSQRIRGRPSVVEYAAENGLAGCAFSETAACRSAEWR